jgi:DNA-binding NarL/FixJ family response regulator
MRQKVTMRDVVKVLLVDDHVLFRRGIKSLLNEQSDIVFIGEAGDYGSAMQFLRANACDVVVTDLTMPGRDGLDLIASVKAIFPKLPILVLTMHCEEEYATRAIRGGANGFITKDASEDELAEAIRRISRGQTAISHKVAEVVAVQLSRKLDTHAALSALSQREFKIYKMLAEGMRVSDMAKELNLSIKTVSTYKARLLQKLGLSNQSAIVRHYMTHRGERSERSAELDDDLAGLELEEQ